MNSEDLKFEDGHMWVRAEGETAVIGLSDYAQDQLGEIIFVELPEEGSAIRRADACGTVESVKSVEDLMAPASGEVKRVNEDALDAPETINEDPYGDGWLLEVELEDPSELDTLMSEQEYEKYLDGLESEDKDIYGEDQDDEE